MTREKILIPFYEMDQKVRITGSDIIGKVCGVRKLESSITYYVAGQWYKENEIEKIIPSHHNGPSFFLPESPRVLFAYVNMRTTKIDHYEHEWAGNQFSKRAPQYDIQKRS